MNFMPRARMALSKLPFMSVPAMALTFQRVTSLFHIFTG